MTPTVPGIEDTMYGPLTVDICPDCQHPMSEHHPVAGCKVGWPKPGRQRCWCERKPFPSRGIGRLVQRHAGPEPGQC
jgi:hypothetical protein